MIYDGPIKRIVVAYDGSDLAKQAFAYAVMLAQRVHCTVVALHVVERLTIARTPMAVAMVADDLPPAPVIDDIDSLDRLKALEDEFDDMADFCWDREVEFKVEHRTGVLADELKAAVNEDDLLAVGQKGRMAKAGIGSMARSLIRQAPCPVLMASGELRPIMRIVAAFDGSEPSLRAVRFARNLAASTHLPFNVLSVGGVTWSADETLEAAQDIAGDAQVIAVGPSDAPEAEQILRAAQHTGLAVIVLGAYPDSWLHQLLFGGPTDQVLRNLHAPLIVVH